MLRDSYVHEACQSVSASSAVYADGVPRERANITLRWRAMEHETIKHISFVDDERPQFIFLILHSATTGLEYVKLIKISQPEEGGGPNGRFRGVNDWRQTPLLDIISEKFMSGAVDDKRYLIDNFYCQID